MTGESNTYLNIDDYVQAPAMVQMVLASAQIGLWDWDLTTGLVRCNREYEQLLGLPPNGFDGQYATVDRHLHADDRAFLHQAIEQAIRDHSSYQHQFRLVWADGSQHWVKGGGTPLYDEAGRAVRIIGTAVATDRRRQTEHLLQQQLEQQQLVAAMTQRIRQSLNLQDILQTTVDQVRQVLQTDRVIIFQFLPDWHGRVVVESCGADWPQILSTEIHDPCFSESYVEPFKQGMVTAKADIQTADIGACHRELLANFQVRANLVVPILQGDELWGLLIAHHCAAPRPWQAIEITLLQQLAAQVGVALQQATLFEQVQTELRERQQSEVARRQSEQRYRTLFESIDEGFCIIEVLFDDANTAIDYRFLEINPQFEQQTGLTDAVGKTARQLLPHLEEYWFEIFGQVALTGEPIRCEHSSAMLNRWFDVYALRIEEPPYRKVAIVFKDISARKQTEMALHQLNTELEQRVLERTTELTTVNDHLRVALKEQQQAKQDVEDLYNQAPCGYHSLDAEGTIVRINDTELSWIGYSRDEVLNTLKFVDLLVEDSQARFRQHFPKFLQQGSIHNLELQLCHRDGSTRWVTLNSTAIRDQMGNFVISRSTLFDISDRKQTEQTLALQAVITRNMAEGICLVRADDATIVYANPKFEQIFGYNPGELNGRHVAVVNHATESVTAEDVYQSIQAAVLKHSEFTYEVHNVKKDGTLFWCSATCSVFKHPEYGDVLVAVHQDITEAKQLEAVRQQAEAALQQQSRLDELRWKMTQAIRQSLDLNTILDAAVAEVRQTLQGDRVAVYRFAPDWSGDFIAESVGPGWVKLVETEVVKVCEDTHLQDTRGGRFQRHETFVISDIHGAGLHQCHIDLLEQFQAKAYAVAPIFSGPRLWGLLAIYQNSSTRHWQTWEIDLLKQIASQLSIALQQSELYGQLQIELKERQQATAVIREAERRWRSLLDNVQLIVVGLDCSGYVNYVNPFFLSLTGYDAAEVIGKNWFEQFLPPTSEPLVRQVFADVLDHNANPHHQNTILTQAGEELLIAWNNTLLQDSDGTVIGTVSIGEDITERQRVEKMKNEFISIVSHELRTPLTSIRGSLGLLATGVMDDDPVAMKHMIDIAAIDTERLVRLVNDVLDLEKLESGKISLMRAWCDAADLMRRSLEVMQNSAQEAGVQLVVQPLSRQIWVDPDRIIQTLTNLLSNAIKFSPPGGSVELSATLVDAGEAIASPAPDRLTLPYVLFQVNDQGRGIPADKLESIFNRFQQVDGSDSRDQGGTGLGLAICQSIVQQHGGSIWVESCWGQGSTFFFTLPQQPR